MQLTLLSRTTPLVSLDQTQTQVRTMCLSILLILFPFAIALALTPGLVAMVFVATLLVAFKTHCLKPFLVTLGVAFAILLFFPTPAAIYCDADYFHLPAIRVIAGDGNVKPLNDGGIWWTHFKACLPDGFHRYGAALYNLTGWVDAANSLLFILIVPAWLTWRQHLGRCATIVILFGPVVFASCFNPLPDGSVYLLLVTALGALKGKQLNLTLAALLVASTLKVTAWAPAVFIAGILLYQHPRQWKRIFITGLAAIVYNIGFFITLFSGESLPTADFAAMEGSARSLGWVARFAYAYLGHWLVPGEFQFNVPIGGFDGGGIDGLGPIFRLLTWISIGCTIAFYKRLKPWVPLLIVCWGSAFCVSTLYMGYARYVPLIYLAIMFPFILLAPRLSLVPAALICAIPFVWIGWRVILITERLTVLDPAHTEAISSNTYNLRCVAREMEIPLVAHNENFIPSASLMYAYLPREEAHVFPAIPRTYERDQRLRPFNQKMDDVAGYVIQEWLPWSFCNLHHLAFSSLRYRFKASLTFPRGKYDASSSNNN